MDGNFDFSLRTKMIKSERPVIVILSGAGLSAESGIPTYRSPGNQWNRTGSLYAEHMRHTPQLVFDSMNQRIEAYGQTKPNAAHFAIADFKKNGKTKPISFTSRRTLIRFVKKPETREFFICTDLF